MSKILDELECARIRNFCQTVPTLEWPSERVHCLLDTIDQLRADLDAMTARAELAERVGRKLARHMDDWCPPERHCDNMADKSEDECIDCWIAWATAQVREANH